MKEEYTASITQLPPGDLPLDASIFSIDLPLLMEQIKKEPTWITSKRNSITVFKTDGLRIVLIALHEGVEIPRHIAEGIISVQVLEGEIKFSTNEQSFELTRGQMLALHERVPHSVLAIKEAMFLLTLTTASRQK